MFEPGYTVRLTTESAGMLHLYSLWFVTLTPNSSSSWGTIRKIHRR